MLVILKMSYYGLDFFIYNYYNMVKQLCTPRQKPLKFKSYKIKGKNQTNFITYKNLAKQYNIKLSCVINGKRMQKNLTQLQKAVHNYEEKNNIKTSLTSFFKLL